MQSLTQSPRGVECNRPVPPRVVHRLFLWIEKAPWFGPEYFARLDRANKWLRERGVFGGVKMPEGA
jgi:hypothetical protein